MRLFSKLYFVTIKGIKEGYPIRAVKDLLSRDWEIRVKHIYREANTVADYMPM